MAFAFENQTVGFVKLALWTDEERTVSETVTVKGANCSDSITAEDLERAMEKYASLMQFPNYIDTDNIVRVLNQKVVGV